MAIFAFWIGLLLGAAISAAGSALWLRRTLARTRAEILQAAALETRALGARIAMLEAGRMPSKPGT